MSSFGCARRIGRPADSPGRSDKLTTFQAINASVNGTQVAGLLPFNLGNQLKPEVTTEVEGGFEAGVWADRVGLQATYWQGTRRRSAR